MRAIASNARFYFDLFLRRQGGLVATVLILYLVGRGSAGAASAFDARWALTGVALVAFALYALVYVEERYLGPFVVLFWAGILSHVRLPESRESRRLGAASGAVLVLLVLLNIAASNLGGASALLGHVPPRLPEPPRETRGAPGEEDGAFCPPRETAEHLGEAGVQPGDRIGFVGYAFGAYFARLAGVKIVAELPAGDVARFWSGDPAMREAVLRAFATTGADAVVAERAPARAALEGWNRVSATGCYLYRLR